MNTIFEAIKDKNIQQMSECLSTATESLGQRDAQLNMNALEYCLYTGFIPGAMLLVQRAEDLTQCSLTHLCSDPQMTLLMLSTRSDSLTRAVLETHQIPIDAQDSQGNTALHRAARMGESPAAALLIEYGASVQIRNNDGHSAYDVAVRHANEEIIKLMGHHLLGAQTHMCARQRSKIRT